MALTDNLDTSGTPQMKPRFEVGDLASGAAAPPRRYRLLRRAEMHGALRDPGYVFTLGEGEVGPHEAVVASNHGAQIADHMGESPKLVDVPLYEEITEAGVWLNPVEETASVDPRAELDAARAANAELRSVLSAALAECDDVRRHLADVCERLKAFLEPATAAAADKVQG